MINNRPLIEVRREDHQASAHATHAVNEDGPVGLMKLLVGPACIQVCRTVVSVLATTTD